MSTNTFGGSPQRAAILTTFYRAGTTMEEPKRHDASSRATVTKHEDIMNVTFVTDAMKNVFCLPIGPEHNAAIAAGRPPEGFELVILGTMVNPKYQDLVAASCIMYQMLEAAKTLIEAHGEHLMSVGTPALMDAGIQFEAMAANLNLAQRQAREGLQAMVAQTEKYRK